MTDLTTLDRAYDLTMQQLNLLPLDAWVDRFSADRLRQRIRPDYITWMKAQ